MYWFGPAQWKVTAKIWGRYEIHPYPRLFGFLRHTLLILGTSQELYSRYIKANSECAPGTDQNSNMQREKNKVETFEGRAHAHCTLPRTRLCPGRGRRSRDNHNATQHLNRGIDLRWRRCSLCIWKEKMRERERKRERERERERHTHTHTHTHTHIQTKARSIIV